MSRQQKTPFHRPKDPAYRRAFERLDEALEENTPCDNSEKIKLLRLAMFGDVDEFEKTDPIILPKP